MSERKRVVVAMSGGVDSSVAAGLLQQAGYEVLGVTMRLWTQEDAAASRHHKRCCSVEDTDDARAAADVLGIRHYVLNLEREFAENVVDHFVREYTLGRTPNPCLECNDRVKFRPLLEHALALDADYLATGHYARVRQSESGFELHRAVDPAKDQSYVLYTLGQAELSRTLFPVGELPKAEIRRLAHEWRLPNADKPDSADICFIPSGDYRAFVRDRVPAAARRHRRRVRREARRARRHRELHDRPAPRPPRARRRRAAVRRRHRRRDEHRHRRRQRWT